MEELVEGDPGRIGPYELLGILGSGGMGRVYLGQTADGERVAVKVVHTDLAREPEFRRRFQREIKALRSVPSSGIAAILDADSEAKRPWLATEYVEGKSLHHVVFETGTLDAPALRALGARLARTLAGIHARQLVHRDIKPTNLLLSEDGPKLIDFGIARDLAASTITRTGLAIGTPQFMAPEQLESGRRTGTAADIFALAGLLVFAASSRGPFGDGTPAQLLYAVVHSEPELGDVPADLRPLLLRCLDKDPAKRPTAEQVAQELEQPPVIADPESTVPVAAGSSGAGTGETGLRSEAGLSEAGSGGRRGRRAAVVGITALAAVVAAAVVLMDGNASGTDNGGRSAKSGVLPSDASGSSTSDPSSGSGTPPVGSGSASGSAAPSSGAVPSSKSGSGSPSGTPTGGGPTGGSDAGPGPNTSGQPVPTHHGSSAGPTTTRSWVTSSPVPTSHAPSPPPGGSAPGKVSGVGTHVNAPEYITMTISWSPASGATSYVVKYTESGNPNTSPVTTDGTSTTINIIPYETVCVQVQAVNSHGVSDWSPSSPDCVLASPS